MRLFIAGICGTFMAGVAQLARLNGHDVYGCDEQVYPPMSTLLKANKIRVFEGYDPAHLERRYDRIIIGNALSRGNPLVEAVLNHKAHYQSGPQWLHDNILLGKDVIAVAGTHGKSTTSSIIAWILHSAERLPGFLIGGKPGNFPCSAKTGDGDWFVIEADEYDTAFFDKRSKFVHYRPTIAVLNNLEFDHGDIFEHIGQIKKQFHHLLRIVPSRGFIVVNDDDRHLRETLDMGYWSNLARFSIRDADCPWFARPLKADCSSFEIFHHGANCGRVEWNLIGSCNMQNALAAVAACELAGVDTTECLSALQDFIAMERRLQLLFSHNRIYLYEDFAHHPTAIERMLEAIRAKHPGHYIITVLELRSNTMKNGQHGDRLGHSLNHSDETWLYRTGQLKWRPESLETRARLRSFNTKEELLTAINLRQNSKTVIICMSNGSFNGVPDSIREYLHKTLVQA